MFRKCKVCGESFEVFRSRIGRAGLDGCKGALFSKSGVCVNNRDWLCNKCNDELWKNISKKVIL